jgi:RimJ/RimL family protein N-acetyltransferase
MSLTVFLTPIKILENHGVKKQYANHVKLTIVVKECFISKPAQYLGPANSVTYKTVLLKNGQSAVLSWLKEADLPEVVEALNGVIREQVYLLQVNEIHDLLAERRWFLQAQEDGMSYLIARVDDKVVGGASLTPLTGKRAHVAEFGIFIVERHRNIGLGTILTKTLIEFACKNQFEIIQLSTFSNNKRAMHVYRKCGFKKAGKLTRDIKFPNGSYTDTITMEQLLKR